MGSRARIVVYAPEEPIDAVRRAFEVIDRCDRAMSDYDPNSESMVLAGRPPGVWHEASPLLIEAVLRSRDAWEASDGAFDITIGAVTVLWRRSKETGVAPTREQLATAQQRVGMSLLQVDADAGRVRLAREGMRLDFGGIGKGLAADLALAELWHAGFETALVEIGGDLVVGSPPPGAHGWSVRVSNGVAPGATLVLANEAVATSGDAYRYVEIDGVPASHVIEPATAIPAPSGGAVAVIAPEGWIADAVATIARLRGNEAASRAGGRLGGVRLVDPAGD
ncbi:MAG: FAD:protein FMN transferase [Phycisphaeraceae bacterium]|nr:MAG: FAD:protein FMN transferase [Phycisphaeraceae bacterium]